MSTKWGAMDELRAALDLLHELNAVRITSTDEDRAVLVNLREKARRILAHRSEHPQVPTDPVAR